MDKPKQYASRQPYYVDAVRYTSENKNAVNKWLEDIGGWSGVSDQLFGGWFVAYSYDNVIYLTHEQFCKEFLINMEFEEKWYD
jgi:hypothetical protein